MIHYYWIPEAPEYPGIYANLTGTDLDSGKIRMSVKQPSTRDPNSARKFNTHKECLEWCNINPSPKFVPREHGFCTGMEDFS